MLFVYEGETPADFAEAERVATAVRRFVGGATPAARMWEVDADLRPEGKQGPLARSVDGFSTYFGRWALDVGTPGDDPSAHRWPATSASAERFWRCSTTSCGATASPTTRSARSAA